MKRASIRFYAELNDYLTPERRGRPFDCNFHVSPTVKDVIESSGAPHTEVELVFVNGDSVSFDHRVEDGDRVSVYPVFESLDIRQLLKVRQAPLRVTRFVLDVHLGRLASYLRMLGFDSLYRNDWDDAELAAVSRDEHRVVLTRDRGVLKRKAITHGKYVRETSPRLQLVEVVDRFDLWECMRPFTRCMACNGLLVGVGRAEIQAAVPSGVFETYENYQRCPFCGRVYWEGSHYRRMMEFVECLRAGAGPGGPARTRGSALLYEPERD